MPVSADGLRRLAALNLSGEAMAIVLGVVADSIFSDDDRRRKDRERKAVSRGKSSDSPQNVHGQSSEIPRTDPPPPAPIRERVLKGSQEEEIDTSSLRSEGAEAPIDPDADLFRRGREVLGNKAGGQVAKLKALYGGDVAKTRSLIEECAVKDRPGEYAAAVLRKHGPQARDGPYLNGSHVAKPLKTNLFIQAAIESQEDADRERQARSFDPSER